MLTLSQDEIETLDSDTQRIGIFFRMATDPVCRFWLGIGDFNAAAHAYDANEETYQGLGLLLDVPALQQLINGVAERLVLRVDGISEKTAVLASADSSAVKDPKSTR